MTYAVDLSNLALEANGTVAGITANATAISAISVGNSTVNTTINSTAFSISGSPVGGVNTSAQYLFSNTISFGNSTVNSSINATSLTVGSNVATFGTALYSVAGGNVGIGTSAPIYKLEVGGSARFGALNTQTVPTGNTLGGVGVTWNFTNFQAETNFWNLYTGAQRAFQFSQITGVGTYTDIMTLSGNGNVGIGNSTPGSALVVNGAIITGNTQLGNNQVATVAFAIAAAFAL